MLLRNKNTGVVFESTDAIRELPYMEVYTPESTVRNFSNLQQTIAEAPSASTKDWRKITKKSDLAEYAKSVSGVVLDETSTLVAMRAQYISAMQAFESKGNGAVAGAVAAQVNVEDGDAED